MNFLKNFYKYLLRIRNKDESLKEIGLLYSWCGKTKIGSLKAKSKELEIAISDFCNWYKGDRGFEHVACSKEEKIELAFDVIEGRLNYLLASHKSEFGREEDFKLYFHDFLHINPLDDERWRYCLALRSARQKTNASTLCDFRIDHYFYMIFNDFINDCPEIKNFIDKGGY